MPFPAYTTILKIQFIKNSYIKDLYTWVADRATASTHIYATATEPTAFFILTWDGVDQEMVIIN